MSSAPVHELSSATGPNAGAAGGEEVEREPAEATRAAQRATQSLRARNRRGIGLAARPATRVAQGARVGYGLAGTARSRAARLSTDCRLGRGASITPHAGSAVGLPAGIAIDHRAHIAVASGTQRQLQDPRQVVKEIEQVADRTALGCHELAEGRKVGLGTGEPHALSEASAKATHPLGLGALGDDAQAGLRSRAGRLPAVIRCTKGYQPELDELFSCAVTVCATDPFAAVDSEQQGTEQEKIEAIVDEFDRMRRAQLESAEISRAFGDAMGTTKRAVEFADNRLHDMTAMLTSALLLAIAGLAPAIESSGRTVTDVVGHRTGIRRVDCGADAKTREHGADAGMLHAAQTELTQAESHE